MNICVYGASSNELDTSFVTAVEALGHRMAQRGHNLIFGAGGRGMMGAAARGVHAEGGRIIGVVPRFFNVDGILFEHCDEMIRTDTMRERKQIMEDRSDAFVMAPGGVGTFDEFFEILTLRQLGRHTKPLAILNVNGYYDTLLAFLREGVEKRFMKAGTLELFAVFTDVDEMLDYLETTKQTLQDLTELKNITK